MTKGSAFLLALGLAAAALLNSGVWEYGDGFIFNRFNGDIIYVDLPEDADLTHVGDLVCLGDTGRGVGVRQVRFPPCGGPRSNRNNR